MRNTQSATTPSPRRRFTLARTLLVLMFLAVAAIAGAAWKLTHGGIPLNFLQSQFEQALESRLPFERIDIGTINLAWDMDASTLLLQLRHTNIISESGAPLAEISNLLLGISPRELLRQRIRLSHVVLVGGVVDIERKRDGSFDLNIVEAADDDGIADDTALASATPGADIIGDILALASPAILSEVLEKLTQSSSIFETLETLEIRGTDLSFNDGKSGLRLHIGDVYLKLRRESGSIEWRISTRINAGVDSWKLAASGRQDIAARHVDVDARIDRDSGTAFPLDSGRLRAHFDRDARRVNVKEVVLRAGENRVSLNGSIEFLEDQKHRIELEGEDIVVHIEGITQSSVPVDRLSLRGNVLLPSEDLSDAAINIEALRLQLPTHDVDIAGSIRAAPRSPELRVSISSAALQKDDLLALWPVPLEDFTREWVAEHITQARLENVLVRMNMDGGVLADVLLEEKPLPKDSLLMETDLYDVTLDYLPPLPEIKNAQGGLRVQDNRFEAWADTATVRPSADTPNIYLQDLRFIIDEIYITDPPSRTSLSFQGEASAVFSLLQGEAIGVRQKDAGIEALQSEGVISGDIRLYMPLYDDIEAHHVDLAINARGEGLLLPLSEGEYRLSDADFDFAGSLKEMRAKGHARINDVDMALDFHKRFALAGEDAVTIGINGAFDDAQLENLGINLPINIDGRIPTSLNLHGDENGIHEGWLRMDLTPVALEEALIGWSKPEEQDALLSLNLRFLDEDSIKVSNLLLQSEGIEVLGDFLFDADNKLVEATLPTIRIGADTILNIHASKQPNDAFTLSIGGRSLDIRDIIDNILGGEGLLGDDDDETSTTFDSDDDESAGSDGEFITHGRIDRLLSHEGIELKDAVFYLHQFGDHVVTSSLDAQLGESNFHLRLDTSEDGDGRRLKVSSGDGGAVLRGLDLYPHVDGGSLAVEADLSPIDAPLEIRGRITGESFYVLNAPAFARLLSLASLSGIEELLSQSGISFEALNLPFELSAQEIRLLDGEMSGPSLGLTLRGSIDRPAKHIDLQGTLVPAYTLNSLLGDIPLLGPMLIGREGEGIFGVTFLVRGPVGDVEIVTNPLSVLTPGFLRRFIEFGENEVDTLNIQPAEERP